MAPYDEYVIVGVEKLTPLQQSLLNGWLPGAVVDEDHSWGLVGTTVLELTHLGSRLIVKAGDQSDRHMGREVHAHLNWLAPLTSRALAPLLTHYDTQAKLLVTHYLPGELVVRSRHANDPQVFGQAGHILALLHAQVAVEDDDFEARENRQSLTWLSKEHRIAADTAELLRAEIAMWPTPPAKLVPTHGDWQPRNWLVRGGSVSVIDFGRAALRPAMTDFARLAAQDFRRDAALEAAFLAGYGTDPRDQSAWHRIRVREAIGTAAWAYQVGDAEFEAQGHRMISEVLSAPPPDG